MDYREALSDREKIKELKYELNGDYYFLKWKWTEEFNCVYIFKTQISEDVTLEEVLEGKYKAFTKEEYKKFGGYREKIIELAQYRYLVYPAKDEYDNKIVIEQNPMDNSIVVCTGKPYIRYIVDEKKKLFSNKKSVRITITSEANIDKDTLCYVKMEGRCPTNKEEGIFYPFYQDFRQGKSILPDIEIGKNEYVNIFFTDGKKYGEMYNLIQM